MAEAQAEALAVATTTKLSGVASYGMKTPVCAWWDKALYPYDDANAGFARSEQHIFCDLRFYTPSNGYTEATLVWPMIYKEDTGDCNAWDPANVTDVSFREGGLELGTICERTNMIVPEWLSCEEGGDNARTASYGITNKLSLVGSYEGSARPQVRRRPQRLRRGAGQRDRRKRTHPGIGLGAFDSGVSAGVRPQLQQPACRHERRAGSRWTHTWALRASNSNTVFRGTNITWRVAQMGDGAQYWFQRNANNGTFSSPVGSTARMATNNSGEYQITVPPATYYAFNSNGSSLSAPRTRRARVHASIGAEGHVLALTNNRGAYLQFTYISNAVPQ